MDNSTHEHNPPVAEEGIAASGGSGAVDGERFSISFTIPELKYTARKAPELQRQLRNVAREAMKQKGEAVFDGPVGMRIWLQYGDNKPNHLLRPQASDVGGAAHTFLSAFADVIFKTRGCVCQMLIAKAEGSIDAIHVSCWALQPAAAKVTTE